MMVDNRLHESQVIELPDLEDFVDTTTNDTTINISKIDDNDDDNESIQSLGSFQIDDLLMDKGYSKSRRCRSLSDSHDSLIFLGAEDQKKYEEQLAAHNSDDDFEWDELLKSPKVSTSSTTTKIDPSKNIQKDTVILKENKKDGKKKKKKKDKSPKQRKKKEMVNKKKHKNDANKDDSKSSSRSKSLENKKSRDVFLWSVTDSLESMQNILPKQESRITEDARVSRLNWSMTSLQQSFENLEFGEFSARAHTRRMDMEQRHDDNNNDNNNNEMNDVDALLPSKLQPGTVPRQGSYRKLVRTKSSSSVLKRQGSKPNLLSNNAQRQGSLRNLLQQQQQQKTNGKKKKQKQQERNSADTSVQDSTVTYYSVLDKVEAWKKQQKLQEKEQRKARRKQQKLQELRRCESMSQLQSKQSPTSPKKQKQQQQQYDSVHVHQSSTINDNESNNSKRSSSCRNLGDREHLDLYLAQAFRRNLSRRLSTKKIVRKEQQKQEEKPQKQPHDDSISELTSTSTSSL